MALAGDEAAQERLEGYNRGDVLATEAAYLRLRGWAKSHPNVALLGDGERRCPACGGDALREVADKVTSTRRYPQYQCQSCGGYCSSGISQGAVDLRSV